MSAGTVCETAKSRFQKKFIKNKASNMEHMFPGEVWAVDCFNKSTLKGVYLCLPKFTVRIHLCHNKAPSLSTASPQLSAVKMS